MDRFAAMIILLGTLVSLILIILTLFSMAPVVTSCVLSLLYSLYLFMAYEESGVHHAQEFENRFWTIFAVLLSTALFFAKDSPLAFGLWWSPSFGFVGVVLSGYAMHVWDRHVHRIAMSSHPGRNWRSTSSASSSSSSAAAAAVSVSSTGSAGPNNSNTDRPASSSSSSSFLSSSQSLLALRNLGIPVEDQLAHINACLREIDQLLIPSTINNFINQRYIQSKEREIIQVFEECDARALNYLIGHVKLGLLFYKIKDHRSYHGKHRTELIHLLAFERLSILTVLSRVILLHSLQLLKLRANPQAEYFVRHILLNTHQDDLSELKTLTDAKGDYFCMNKLIYDDIRSESVRQDILHHIRRQAAIQQMHWQTSSSSNMMTTTTMSLSAEVATASSTAGGGMLKMMMRRLNRPSHLSMRPIMTWRKVLSDVDDTLYSSGGMYPAGIDKRYPKKTVYPGALAFYRELDLGTEGPEEWEDDRVGNLVFLSARPHVYKDMSEKHNFAKFEKLRAVGHDGRKGMHTTPSLLAGDIASGSQFVLANDFEPLARKKFDNFRRYVGIYPEYQHVFVCDNGQGDVRAGEMMFDSFPYEFEALYVHIVQDVHKTHGYDLERWKRKEFSPFFFRTYPEAALHAACRNPPMIRMKGLQRICQDTVKDFALIATWTSEQTKAERRRELNQSLWLANRYLEWCDEELVELIQAGRLWKDGDKVRTPYGAGIIRGFDPVWDLYDVDLDWRPIDVQVKEYEAEKLAQKKRPPARPAPSTPQRAATLLATVHETDEQEDDAPSARPDDDTRSAPGDLPSSVSSPENQPGGEPSAEQSTSSRPRGPHRSSTMDDNIRSPSPIPTNVSLVEETDTRSSMSAESEATSSSDQDSPRSASKPFAPKARLSGACISKYTPPTLPRVSVRSSLFTFMTTTPAPETPKRRVFKVGEEYSSPYGVVKVIEWREASGIVVVDMIGWHARAYLQQDLLSPVPQNILRSLLRQFSNTGDKKPPEFPHAQGTVITTPFGQGSVKRPLPSAPKGQKDIRSPPTMGISLDTWTLADGSHPMLYCTVETARAWKDRKEDDNVSIFSTLGSIVSSSRSLFEPFLQQQQQPSPPKPPTEVVLPKKFERYFQDAASVSTPYGAGRVIGFRESDGFYEVALTEWELKRAGKQRQPQYARAFLRGVDLRCCVARGCQEGYPVLTSLGMTGILASVEPTTSVNIVTIPSARMVCYLQPECVVRPLKAAVGEDVLTMFGDGKVVAYDAVRDMYTIQMLNWAAKLYAKGDTFDRVVEGVQERDGPFGVNWLLRLLFFSSSQEPPAAPARSRSNSIVSGVSQKSKT